MRKAPLVAFIAVLCCGMDTLLLAQAPPAPAPSSQLAAAPPNSVKVETRLITVDVVATDSHGNLIRDLAATDFQVFDEHSASKKSPASNLSTLPSRPRRRSPERSPPALTFTRISKPRASKCRPP
jgi:hypothetical protein